jgi:hypothetical protein
MTRARLAALKLAEELFRQVTEVEEQMQRAGEAVTRRHAALMRKFDRHTRIADSLPCTDARMESAKRRRHREIKAAVAAMLAARHLTDQFSLEMERIGGRAAKLLRELRPVLKIIGARERARLVANYQFWHHKMKGEK